MHSSSWADGAREHDGVVQRQQSDGPEVAAVAAEAQKAAEHQQRAPVKTKAGLKNATDLYQQLMPKRTEQLSRLPLTSATLRRMSRVRGTINRPCTDKVITRLCNCCSGS